jgi:hypothetical protein
MLNKMMEQGRLLNETTRQRRRKNEEDETNSSLVMMTQGVNNNSPTTRGRKPRRRFVLDRTTTPMLEMIEKQQQDSTKDDDVSSQESMVTISDDSSSTASALDNNTNSNNNINNNNNQEDERLLDTGITTTTAAQRTSLDSSSSSEEGSSKYEQKKKKKKKQSNRKLLLKNSSSLFPKEQLDVDKYMASREMTPFQERMNAVTVMPGAFYCIMFLLSGMWLKPSFIQEYEQELLTINTNNGVTTPTDTAAESLFDDSQCLSLGYMPHLHALPPLPLVAAALGIIFHAPFSFIYHWKFAHRLPSGLPRTTHWSRRMDQVMIHVCSGCMAYATSGRIDFFLVNAIFNIDCIYRQFMEKVYPRRNQIRIFISIVAYTIPWLRRGDFTLFAKVWFLFGISGWLFSQYPIGGWSHSAFHIVMAFVPPLLMTAAVELPASQSQLKVAAQCALLAKENLVVS